MNYYTTLNYIIKVVLNLYTNEHNNLRICCNSYLWEYDSAKFTNIRNNQTFAKEESQRLNPHVNLQTTLNFDCQFVNTW